ncbi:MAG: hypothetical protein K9N06_13930 [Candidatus Cloacimonetes bacterium]|nr:hypothetical protein [Candidatus Cloacimonadota bacterium]
MEKVRKENIMERAVELPDSSGCVGFYRQEKMIYCRMSSNIDAYLKGLFQEDIDDANLGEMLEACELISYEETESIFAALLLEKFWKYEYQPQYNKRYRDYDPYQYLGINFVRFPFLKLENDTIKDYFYVGPFRDGYLVRDAIDVLSRLFGTPVCAELDFPCYLAENKQCKGYCIRNQEFLAVDLVRYFLLPEQKDLSVLEEWKQKLLAELKFRESDELASYQRILQRFYSRITFLAVTKWLDAEFEYKGKQIKIKNGLLGQDGSHRYLIVETEYQPHELYAVEKAELDERWVIFNYIKNMFPEKLKAGYELSRKQLADYLIRKENK